MDRNCVNEIILKAASGEEVSKKAGVPSPKNAPPENGFVVKSWLWNEKDQDYRREDPGATGRKFFEEYADANEHFEKAAHKDFFAGPEEGKIELIQYKYGLGQVIKSRILFPRARH